MAVQVTESINLKTETNHKIPHYKCLEVIVLEICIEGTDTVKLFVFIILVKSDGWSFNLTFWSETLKVTSPKYNFAV